MKARGLREKWFRIALRAGQLDKMIDGQREQNQNGVGEPGIQGGKMKSLG